jgi:hypothetical protein
MPTREAPELCLGRGVLLPGARAPPCFHIAQVINFTGGPKYRMVCSFRSLGAFLRSAAYERLRPTQQLLVL